MGKNIGLLFFVHIVLASHISAQPFFDKTGQLASADVPIAMDGTPLLKGQDEISSKFFKKFPGFLTTNKLQKTTGWNFTVGTNKVWYTVDFATEKEYPTATTCRAVGKHCYVFVQDAVWTGNVTQNIVDSVVAVFDNRTPANPNKGIFQATTETFGEPPDIDNDPKIVVLLLDIKDNSAVTGSSIAGYFSSANEVPKSEFSLSNEAEIIFIDVNPNTLTTPVGLRNGLSTIAHEFQHLIAWDYNKDGSQWTFIKEGCSLLAEVINGFPFGMARERFYTREPNHYLFDWRYGSSDVQTDYARAAKFHIYLWDQFGAELFKRIVQDGKNGIEAYRNAVQKIGSNKSIEEIIFNWSIANFVDDRSIDPAIGYTSRIETSPVATLKFLPEGTVSKLIEPYASECIFLGAGENITATFSCPSNYIKVKAILSGNAGKKIIDINSNSTFTTAEFGNKYNTCSFVMCNAGSEKQELISCQLSGKPTKLELNWNSNKVLARYANNPNDTIGVVFDAIKNGKLDSIKVAVFREGILTAKIYRLPCKFKEAGNSAYSIPISTLISNGSETKAPTPFPYPYTNWITLNLSKENISTDEPFVIGFGIPGDTSAYPLLMMSFTNSYDENYSCTYRFAQRQWQMVAFPFNKYFMIPIVYAYVHLENVSSALTENEPSAYMLHQNYPNPFNPSTKIVFSIPKKGKVIVKIYDVMGGEIMTLLDDVREAGDHEIAFSAANISSGVYFYRIQCDDFVDTKKMVLLR